MIDNLELLYSSNAKRMKRSVIRELLKLTAKPEIISFAGGLPSPLTFPKEKVREATMKLFERNEINSALQYGTTEGDLSLRIKLARIMEEDGVENVEPENILITTASQQALDLVGKVFLDRHDSVVVGLPDYVGALQAFTSYSADFIGIPLDNDGMMVDRLEELLEKAERKNIFPKFIYTVPDFQNPTGITLSLERRRKLLKIARRYDMLIVEDCPYRELIYEGEKLPSLLALDEGEGYVIQLATFSKTFLPGFRLGWITARKEIINKFVVARQAMDLCTPPFTQAIINIFLEDPQALKNNIANTIRLYKEKRDHMLAALDKYMPKVPGLKWTRPNGGMFLWVTLPEYIDADELFYKAVEKNVAYVIGSAFHCNGKGQNTFRLNFSYPTLEEIDEGIRRLADVISSNIRHPELAVYEPGGVLGV